MRIVQLISTFFLVLTIVGFQACSEDISTAAEVGELIEVLHSSGDNYSYMKDGERHFYAPYPFNQGSIAGKDGTKHEVVVLSKQAAKGSIIGVEIFAKMTIMDVEGNETSIFISSPTNPTHELTPIENFYDFSVEQFYFKQMVQYWYSNRYGLNGTIVKGWEPVSTDTFKG